MKPELASPEFAGLPITSLLRGTPDAAIWKSAVCGHVLLELVNRFAQVVYSLVPSVCKKKKSSDLLPWVEETRRTVVELDVVLRGGM